MSLVLKEGSATGDNLYPSLPSLLLLFASLYFVSAHFVFGRGETPAVTLKDVT